MLGSELFGRKETTRIFNQKTVDLDHLTDNVKLMSFSWLKANMLTLAFGYDDWWRHPLLCMGVIV